MRRIELAYPDIYRMIRWARVLDVYWIDVDAPREQVIPTVTEIFYDPVLKWLFTGDLIPSAAGRHGGVLDLFEAAPHRSGNFWGIERRYRGGVTDNVGRSAREAFEIVLQRPSIKINTASGSMLLLEGPKLTEDELAVISRNIFCNELIQSWTILPSSELRSNERFHPENIKLGFPRAFRRMGENVKQIPLENLNDDELSKLSVGSLWALNLKEMKAIRDYFNTTKTKTTRGGKGLDASPTDVEMEILAQTWSEHCKHKIFNSKIEYSEVCEKAPEDKSSIPKVIDSLFKKTISKTTDQLKKPWLISVFTDNAGIVSFDEEDAICIKVETHNSPSALDPYGGSLTGIVGVNRDILGCGRGAKPIFNTDVFCLATPDYNFPLPDRILHPRRILNGMRQGVEDGGNQSGIPTINGALVFDSRYLGKPLIYCGTGGILPKKSAGYAGESKNILPGDRVVMIGGRIGKDGIHGATFSSLALDENSPSSAVQLGDPITQKRMTDFLMEARESGLYRTLTDNGAGGLSSSVGELAEISNGARIDVSLAKTKYPGLKPFELIVSESQERMTLAVPPGKMEGLKILAKRRGVEWSDIGEFNDSGNFEIKYEGKTVALLDLKFLHHGDPQLEIKAKWDSTYQSPGKIELDFKQTGAKKLLDLLGRPNIASKEWLIRQYDHEVQGTSVIKPLHTRMLGTNLEFSGPNDAAVLKPKTNSNRGIAVSCGINPKYSDIDPYLMAQMATDEAVRNILAVGAEYGMEENVLALVDNFCWPDPVSNSARAADLVRACYGLRDACLALETPLISGKDSMKNDFRGKKGDKEIKISVPPTLLVTALGCVKDIRETRTSDFKSDGQVIYLIGGKQFGLLGSEFHSMAINEIQKKGGSDPQAVLPTMNLHSKEHRLPFPDWNCATQIYRWLGGALGEHQDKLASVHDISEGGLLVAVTESLMARGLGAKIKIPKFEDYWEFCFGEAFHSFIVSTAPIHSQSVEQELKSFDIPYLMLGHVQKNGILEIVFQNGLKEDSWVSSIDECRKAWMKEGYWE